jgi:hypothetical protein
VGLNREQLNDKATQLGIDPALYKTKAALIAAIQAAEQGIQPNGILVVRTDQGTYDLASLGDVKPMEVPTILRQAANAADVTLGIG